MIESLAIPAPSVPTVTISGGWTRRSSWDWVGTLAAPEPIVGMAFLRVGNHVEWARSEKTVHPEMEIRLLLGRYDSTGLDVQPCFSIGENSVRWRTVLNDADDLPSIPETRPIQVGHSFMFCATFGMPMVALYGLVLLRRQVVSSRVGIWHLKAEYSSLLVEPWKRIFTHGRAGSFEIPEGSVEPLSSPRGQ